MPTKKTATKRTPQPRPAPPAKTRFRVELKFELEVDGDYGAPPWLSDKYKSFIIGGLLKQECSVPITLVPGSSAKLTMVGARDKPRRGPVSFNWIAFKDRDNAGPIRVFEDVITSLKADGSVEKETKVPR